MKNYGLVIQACSLWLMRQYLALAPVITTCGDLECFIAAVMEYEVEAE
ncbi:hypothetical protein [Photobacterium kishitanii]|nr:hypothetical protein [Photobacterium kishitanii]